MLTGGISESGIPDLPRDPAAPCMTTAHDLPGIPLMMTRLAERYWAPYAGASVPPIRTKHYALAERRNSWAERCDYAERGGLHARAGSSPAGIARRPLPFVPDCGGRVASSMHV